MNLPLTYGLGACLALLFGFTQWQSRRIEAQFPARGEFVDVEGGRLHYTQILPVGPVRGTVLLLHGASGNQADVMVPLGDTLAARGFRVIAFDRPGYGWSDRPQGRADATPERQAQLIRSALTRLGIDGAIVLGHSLAGVLATNLALDHADFTQGLVLVAPVTHPWPGGDISWYYTPASLPLVGEIFTELLTLPAGMATLDTALAGVFSPQAAPADYDRRTGVALVLRPAAFRANAQDVASIYAAVTRQAPRLGQIKAPTVIVTGDRDTIVLTKVHSYGSARDIPDAELRVLPGIGHSPHWSDPNAVVEAVESVAARRPVGPEDTAAGKQTRVMH
jgi:pimeloyl-ACP methyl ester carboxylesterase